MDKKWDLRFLKLAKEIASWSKDPSTKCGAVIVKDNFIVSTGFNGYPKGVPDDDSLHDRAVKYRKIIHAELNAILYAKRDLSGCTIYVYPMPPCSQCTSAIVQSGISMVVSVAPSNEHLSRWGTDMDISFDMLKEAGVLYTLYENTF